MCVGKSIFTEAELNAVMPMAEAAFNYVKGKFGKYKAYMKLASFRAFHFAVSEDLERAMGPLWRKYKHD